MFRRSDRCHRAHARPVLAPPVSLFGGLLKWVVVPSLGPGVLVGLGGPGRRPDNFLLHVPVVAVKGREEAAARLAGLGGETSVALGDVGGALKDGLLAFTTSAGLLVVWELMMAEMTELIGPKHAKNPDRVGNWLASTKGSVVWVAARCRWPGPGTGSPMAAVGSAWSRGRCSVPVTCWRQPLWNAAGRYEDPVGLWAGDTENKTVVSALLADLVARGLRHEDRILVVKAFANPDPAAGRGVSDGLHK